MINVDEIKQFVDSIANKEQSGNSYTPNIFNLWLRRGADAIFKKEYGLAEDYKPGAPLPDIGYELTQKIKDDLRVFKETVTIVVDVNGKAILPTDYVHYTSFEFQKVVNAAPSVTITPKFIEVIDDDKWTGRKNHPVKGPSKDYPILNFNSDHVLVEPKDLYQIDITYLRYPVTPEWAFTVEDGVEKYDAGNSTNVELPQMLTNDIGWFILSYLGIRNADDVVTPQADKVKTVGL